MQKSYECEVATHIGPESLRSCSQEQRRSVDRGTCGPGIQPRKFLLRDADAVRRSGRPHLERRYREALQSPARSETPCTYADTSLGNREIPCSPKAAVALGRVGSLRTYADDERTWEVGQTIVPEKSPKTPGNWQRRGWREAVWPKGTCHSKTRPGHRAGRTRRVRWSGTSSSRKG